MKRILLVTTLLTALATPVYAGVNEGVAAATAGDYARAFTEFEPLANAGDPVAQYYLAKLYLEGRGPADGVTRGVDFMTKAANGGYPEAQAQLGLMYAMGMGVPVDNVKAHDLLTKALVALPDGVRRAVAEANRDTVLQRMTPAQRTALASRTLSTEPAPTAAAAAVTPTTTAVAAAAPTEAKTAAEAKKPETTQVAAADPAPTVPVTPAAKPETPAVKAEAAAKPADATATKSAATQTAAGTKPADAKPADKPATTNVAADSKPADAKPAAPKPTTTQTAASDTKPAEAKPADKPAAVVADSKPADTKPADAKPTTTQTASAAPATPATEAQVKAGARIQIASLPTEDGAWTGWKDLSAKYKDQLTGLTPVVESADLGTKGIFYRVRVGPFENVAAATTRCDAMKQAGLDCLVVKK
jgi:uncharacterized protein